MSAQLTARMQKSIDTFKQHLASLRTNRANADMLNGIVADYYGSPTSLKQLASISVPEGMVIQLNVFDAAAVKSIDKAIQLAQLGFNPQIDGTTIRIRLPELTEERRKDLVKVVKKYAEEARVSIRNIRREEIDTAKTKEKNKEINEDESKKTQALIQKITDENITTIDKLAEAKEKDIITI
jgi:ribosome recycling factor